MRGPLVLADKYALLRRLGRGGMAEVFLARQMGPFGFEKLVVVKRTLPRHADDATFRSMFLDEARTAADLRHPNIVSVLDVGEDRGQLYIAMEFLHGRDVGKILRRSSRRRELPPLARALDVVMGIAAALDYAHRKTSLAGEPLELVHRDVSPQNIVVTYDGEPMLVDFGIARAASRDRHTDDGSVRGKVAYMAPEQIEGEPVDGRADQFALGIVLYELTTLRPLFAREATLASLGAILAGDILPPSKVVAGYPKDLEEVVLRTLSRRPVDRFESCAALLEALDRVAERNRLTLHRRRMSTWLQHLFADEIEDDRTLAHMPVLGASDDSSSPADEGRPTASADTPSSSESADGLGHAVFAAAPPGAVAHPRVEGDPGPGRLPDLSGPFFGRTRLISDIRSALSSGVRLLTLHGGGGAGKTRLAVELARALDEEALAVAVFVDLSRARTVEDLCMETAQSIGLTLDGNASTGDRAAQIGRALASRRDQGRRTLLVLDAHPMLEPSVLAPLAAHWYGPAGPALAVVTAAAPLGLDGERRFLVGGLDVPSENASASDVVASAAGQLFLAAARDEVPGYVLTDEAAPAVARALREVAGAPLAVEMAAARLLVSTGDLEEVIPTRPAVHRQSGSTEAEGVDAGGIDAVAALDKAVDQALRWALDSLSPAARALAKRISVFPAGFTLALATRVVGADGADPERAGVGDGELIRLLDVLRTRALLRVFEPDGLAGTLRYEIVPSLRAKLFVLLEEDERVRLSRQMADAVLEEALPWARAIDGPGGTRLFARLAAETPNLLDVLAGAVIESRPSSADVARGLRAALAVDPVLTARGYTNAHLALLDRVIDAGRATSAEVGLLAMAVEARADAHKSRGHLEQARADYQAALRLAHEAGDRWFAGLVERNLAEVLATLGQLDESLAASRRSLEIFREVGDRHFEARAHLATGRALRKAGNTDRAARHLAAALDIFRHVGDRRFEGRALSDIARLRADTGERDRAVELYEIALRIHQETGDMGPYSKTLVRLGSLLGTLGRRHEASERLDAAREVARQTGNRRIEDDVARLTRVRAEVTS